MKRIITLLMALMLLLCFAGCADNATSDNNDTGSISVDCLCFLSPMSKQQPQSIEQGIGAYTHRKDVQKFIKHLKK